MSSKKKTVTKTKTPRPEPIPADGTPLRETSARFKKLIAGTATEPTPYVAPTPEPDAPTVAPVAHATPRPRAAWVKKDHDGQLCAESIKTIGDAYIAHLQATGKSPSTVDSYAADLECAYDHFSPGTDATKLTPEQIEVFNESDVVTKKKSGATRAMPTILKTRRVLRLALTWAVEMGTICTSPYAAEPAMV